MSESTETAGGSEFLTNLMRGADLLRANQLDEARGVILTALALEPGEARARNLLGLVHFRLGELAESRDLYRGLCADFPADTGYRLNLGLVHLRIGEVDDAIAELGRVVAVEPSNQRALGYLGLAYAQVGDAERARDAFVKAGQPDLAREMEGRLAAAAVAAAGEAPAAVSEFAQERTAVAPDDVIQRAVQKSAEPDEDDVDAAFDELEHGFEAAQAGAESSPPEPGAPPPYEEAVFGEGEAAAAAPASTPSEVPAAAAPVGSGEAAAALAAAPVAPAEPAPAPAPGAFDVGLLAEVARRGEPEAAADGLSAREGEAEEPVAIEGEEDHDASGATPVTAFVTSGLLHPSAPGTGFTLGSAGGLLCRIDGAMVLRLDGGVAVSGNLELSPTRRRVRGRLVEEILGGDRPFSHARGTGSIFILPGAATFMPLLLHDDIVYVREEAVHAFSDELHWESGRIPGLGSAHPMLQFRGRGWLALRLHGALSRIKLDRGQTLGVDAEALFGWVGRVVPHALVGGAGRALGCTGEGVILLRDPEGPSRAG